MADDKVVHKELSYAIVGMLFDVYNELGFGHKERYYENAVAVAFEEAGIKYQRQVHVPLTFKGKPVGRQYLDFLVEGKVVLELKQGNYFSKHNIQQVKEYLASMNLQLGILANFTSSGVKFRRVLNIENL